MDYRDIFINLDHDPENDEQIVVTEQQQGKRYRHIWQQRMRNQLRS